MCEHFRRNKFQKNPSNGRQDRVEKILRFSSKVPFFIAQSQRKLQCLLALQGKGEVINFKKNALMEAKIQRKRYFVLQVKRPLLSYHKPNRTFCNVCMGRLWYDVAGNSLQCQPRYKGKGTLFSK
jgi:hypothetical protein